MFDYVEPAFSSGISNIWDDGYPSGGNYWSDYNGTDLFSGPHQNETGSDGIGDTPYLIRFDSQDNYPLMKNWDGTSPWADDDNDGILNYLDIPNFDVLTSSDSRELFSGFNWPVQIASIFPSVDNSYLHTGLSKWGVKPYDVQHFMLPVVIDLGNFMGALTWLRDHAPWLITAQIVNKAGEYLCSDGHLRFLFVVHSDFTWIDVAKLFEELTKALFAQGTEALNKWLDFFAELLDLVGFEFYLLKGAYSVGANLVYDFYEFVSLMKDMMAFKDVSLIALDLIVELIKASMTGGASFLGVAGKLLLKTLKLAIDYIAYDWLKIRHWTLDWIKMILKLVDPPGERVVLQLHNLTTQELLLGYNSTSGTDISVFPHGIYSSENDSAIMILSRSTADYNFTVNAYAHSSVLPHALVTWDCVENLTITTGGFLEPGQTTSSIMRTENNVLELSYLVVEANFSDFTPHVGEEVVVNIKVTDNLGNTFEGTNTTIVVDDLFIPTEDLGDGKYQATLDTASMLGFYNVTIFTAETPTGCLQGMSTYPLRIGTADIAITNVTCSKTAIGQGDIASVNATVRNNGNLNETFHVTLYANTTAVQKQAVILLSSGNSTVVTFTWNTTDFAYGNYTMSAVADTVPGETDTVDNTYIDGTVLVTIAGDIDGDLDVDYDDFIVLAGAYGSSVGDPAYVPEADFDGDGEVDYDDFIVLAGNYGTTAI